MSINKKGQLTTQYLSELTNNKKSSIGKKLPSSYQEVEYIESTGTQYINCNLTETDDIAYDLHIYNTNVSSNYLYGAKQASASSSSSGSMMYNGLYSNNSLEYNWKTISYTASNDVYMNQIVNGTNIKITINNQIFNVSTGTCYNTNVYIFACNGGGRLYTGMKLYYFRIKQGGVMTRNFIPCYRISDTVIGLYDTINNVFYTNAGSGTFNKGNNISSNNNQVLSNNLIEF